MQRAHPVALARTQVPWVQTVARHARHVLLHLEHTVPQHPSPPMDHRVSQATFALAERQISRPAVLAHIPIQLMYPASLTAHPAPRRLEHTVLQRQLQPPDLAFEVNGHKHVRVSARFSLLIAKRL